MRDINSVSDLSRALVEAKHELEAAQTWLERQAKDAAESERVYRKKRARDWAQAVGTNVARDRSVDESCADERYQAKLDEDLRMAALEKVRSCRALLTSVQTLSNAWREEVAYSRMDAGAYAEGGR